jgi:Tol biopolymer transport system component
MSSQYGPWATSIDAGGNPQLSTFWRRRMTMLVPTSQTSPVLSRRTLLCLGVAGAATAMLPTLLSRPTEASDEKAAGTSKGPSSGRIYVAAVWTEGDNGPALAQGGVIAIDPDTGRWEKVCGGVQSVRVSPDGKRIARRKFVRAIPDPQPEPIDILAHDLETGEESRLSDEEGVVSWSPDGKEIVVSQRQSGTWRVSGGSSQRLPIPDTDTVCDWSSDGRWFVTESTRDWAPPLGYQIYRMRPDGSEQLRLTNAGRNLSPRFSPDGRRILYCRDSGRAKDENHELRVVNVDGTNDHVILRNDGLDDFEQACWSPDGKRIVVVWVTWKRIDGTRVLEAGETKHRIEVISADGAGRRLLKLGDVKMLHIYPPDWR